MINKIGVIVQIISNNWFSFNFLFINLFFILKLIINNIIIKIFKIIIIKKLCNIIVLIKLIEFGFWKFKFIQFVILFNK